MNRTRHTKESGQAVIIATVFFLVIGLSVIVGISSPVLKDVALGKTLDQSKDTYFLAEGLTEDIVYRLKSGKTVSSAESLTLLGNTATANITDIFGGKRITSTGDVSGRIRRVQTDLVIGLGASFNFGVQTDNGGFVIENTGSVNGNIFSNGTIEGSNSNLIRGDVISAGEDGLIDGIHATGTAYAHTIAGSQIEKDAYYQEISGSTVLGSQFPNSPDQATTSLPITDAMIEEWKVDALSGGAVTCTNGKYTISNAATIGPKYIPCDLVISGNNFTVSIEGALWVDGDIDIQNSPTIEIASSLAGKSVPIIAHDESDELSGGVITIRNSAEFDGASGNSYVLLVSQNESAENGGGIAAITIENSANGDVLLYAGHGEVRIRNSVSLKEVTSWRVRLQNSASVTYESGLANLLFTSGPGGSFHVNSWREVE